MPRRRLRAPARHSSRSGSYARAPEVCPHDRSDVSAHRCSGCLAANVLLYASDTESAYAECARTFLVDRPAGPDTFYLAWPTIMSYLRIASHPGVYRGVAGIFPLRGNAVPDAHVAALFRQHGVDLICTNDADFKRFPFLTVVNRFEP